MPYEQKPNTGSLWASPERKISKEGRPYEIYKGRAYVICPHCQIASHYWLSAYLNDAPRGQVYDFYFKERQQAEQEFKESQY